MVSTRRAANRKPKKVWNNTFSAPEVKEWKVTWIISRAIYERLRNTMTSLAFKVTLATTAGCNGWQKESLMRRILTMTQYLPILLLSVFVLVPLASWAALGDNAASVLNDQARMKGTLRSTDAHTYVMHEITASSGTVVREFVSPAGAVFGVAWEGTLPPDLQQLLGPYYQQAKQVTQSQPRQGRRPISIETEGLVLQQTGHPRSFQGRAYIPQLVPNSVDATVVH